MERNEVIVGGLPRSLYLEEIRKNVTKGPYPDTSHLSRKWLDIEYGSIQPTQRLDIYLPNEGCGPFPVIFWVHGGAWLAGEKDDWQISPHLPALDHGFALVAVRYALSYEAIFPRQIYDLKAAIRFVRLYGNEYLLNTERLGLWGGSAGGYLASLAGTSSGIAELDSPWHAGVSDQVQAVCAISPVIDLLEFAGQTDDNTNPAALFLGDAVSKKSAVARLANPETWISSSCPPFYLHHGTKDELVQLSQSSDFAEKLRTICGEESVTLSVVEDAGHHGNASLLSPEEIVKQLEFFSKFLK